MDVCVCVLFVPVWQLLVVFSLAFVVPRVLLFLCVFVYVGFSDRVYSVRLFFVSRVGLFRCVLFCLSACVRSRSRVFPCVHVRV